MSVADLDRLERDLKAAIQAGGGAATVADGANVAEGSITDAAVVSDANGTLSGKLRGVVKILADVWDSTNHLLKVVARSEQYTAPATGEVAGSVSSAALPSVPGKLVCVKARLSNAGNVYVGVGTVTKAAGTTTTTAGYELGPGDATPWIPTDNLNRLARICDNAGDGLTYLVLA